MPNANTKPIPVVYFQLAAPADIVAAMQAMLTIDYQGELLCEKENDVPVWRLTISNRTIGVTVRAVLGDILVWEPTSNHIDAMSPDAFAAQYDIS